MVMIKMMAITHAAGKEDVNIMHHYYSMDEVKTTKSDTFLSVATLDADDDGDDLQCISIITELHDLDTDDDGDDYNQKATVTGCQSAVNLL